MFMGLTALAVATCFCLGSTPVPEQLPVAPDALTTRVVAPADAIPERCLTGARAWAHMLAACPLMPVTVSPAPEKAQVHARVTALGRAF